MKLTVVFAAVFSCLWGDTLRALESQPVRTTDTLPLTEEHTIDLIGYGIVVGLAGTGGSSESTKRTAIKLVQEMELREDPQARAVIQRGQLQTGTISVVQVTASLPRHVSRGQKVDVTLSTLDDAESLRGGVLVRAPLKGVEGVVYAVAGGSISTSGGEFGGEASPSVRGHVTVGHIPRGATVKVEVPSENIHQGAMHQLRHRSGPEHRVTRRGWLGRKMNKIWPF
jgi:flagellar P-ring protein precursor FlgI